MVRKDIDKGQKFVLGIAFENHKDRDILFDNGIWSYW